MNKTVLFTQSQNAVNSSYPFKTRLDELLKNAKEMKALVGFFYFSGIKTLYDSIKENNELKLKILVGLDAEEHMSQIIEFAQKNDGTSADIIESYLDSLRKVVSSKCRDDQTFYERVSAFIDLLKENRLEIRKTRQPNHAKMYVFSLKEGQMYPNVWLTGSSNLTWKALEGQQELNVDLGHIYQEDANAYFDELWEDSIPLTDNEEVKQKIIKLLEDESVVAQVTPFEAYAKVLKTIAEKEEIQEKTLDSRIAKVLEKAGYNNFKYQTDAVLSALNIVEKYNGVVIADVVGLGKSIIASLLGNLLTGSGLVIAPPSLVGNNWNEGWKKYLKEFGLQKRGWEVKSLGMFESNKWDEKFEDIKDLNFDTIIIDEAHRFRNQDMDSYSKLWQVCNGKKVILLTATPFNNSPADFASLLQLFMDMGAANLCAGGDLQEKFQYLTIEFSAANYLLSHLPLKDSTQQNECKKRWNSLFGEEYENVNDFSDDEKCLKMRRRVKKALHSISKEVREIIAPVTIRRNRIDIKNDPEYAKDVKDMSKVVAPKEQFYELSSEQNEFYDNVVNVYLGDEHFTGAAYRPYAYSRVGLSDDMGDNVQQEGMYKFMRRLLVRRFESSFGAFAQTVKNAIDYYRMVKRIAVAKGIVFQSRKYLEKYSDLCEENASSEAFDALFEEINRAAQSHSVHDKDEIFDLNSKTFDKVKFLADLDKDIGTFNDILKEIDRLQLLKNDPKALQLLQIIKNVLDCNHPDLNAEKNRKVIVFTEYQDTISHLKKYFDASELKNLVLIPDSIGEAVLQNFDASSKKQDVKYQVLVVSDRFSEGLNLSRVGLVINYDIPWNPTRVIQRIGRINRIGNKVFDKLYIFNYFPTEQGCDIIHSKEIAANKMSMIYKILGEDAQVLTEEDDDPKPSQLYEKVNADPEDSEEMSPLTRIRLEWQNIQKKYPEIAERVNALPNRIKSASEAREEEHVGQYVLKKKGALLWCVFQNENGERKLIHAIDFADRIKCKVDAKALEIKKEFWDIYKTLSELDPKSIERENNTSLSNNDVYAKSLRVVVEAMRCVTPGGEIYKFLELLADDIQNWRTIPKYDLRILSKLPGNDPDAIYNKMLYLREMLETTKEKRMSQRIAAKQDDEVVIGVEKR